MKRALSLMVLLLGSCLATRPPNVPGAEVVVRYPLEGYQLPNGLRVVLERSPDFGRAGAVLLVGAGSAAERPGQEGLAHLVEHLVFEAKPNGVETLEQAWAGLGAGSVNGKTSWDTTTYLAFVPKKNLNALLVTLAAVLRDPLVGIDDQVFSHERQIVTNELRLRGENGASGQALGWLASSLFPPGHPYAHMPVGNLRSLSRLAVDDARAFAAAHYRPQAATLVVTAPVGLPELKALVGRIFGFMPGGRRDPRTPSLPPPRPASGPGLEQIAAHEASVVVPELWIGWIIPGGSEPDSDIPELLADMVGGVFWSNVYQRDGDISRVDALVEGGIQASVFVLRVQLKDAKDPEASARSVVREVLRGLSDRTHTFGTFDIYERFQATDLTYAEEPMVGRALRMAWSKHVHDDPVFIRGRGARVLALTPDRVDDYFLKRLDQNLARAVVIRPVTDDPKVVSIAPRTPPHGLFSTDPPDARTAQQWLLPLGLGHARRTRLASGLEVIALSQAGSPFHTALLGFHTGVPGDETGGVVPAASWAMQTRAPHPALRGVFYAPRFGRDSLTFLLRATGSAVGPSLGLLRQTMDEYQISWPPPQFMSQLKLFEREDQSPEGSLRRALAHAVYGEHPFGQQPTPAGLRRVTPKQVHDWMSDVLRADNGALVIVGDVDEEAALAAASRQFGGFRSSARHKAPVPEPPPLERAQAAGSDRFIVRHQPGSTQALLTFSCVLPPVTPENLMTERLFKTMLARRFFAELREQRGASYLVDAGLTTYRGGTSVVEMSADVDYSELGEALARLRCYIEQPAEAAFDQTLLTAARAQMAAEFNLSHSTTLALAEALFAHWNQGWPLDTVDRTLNRLWTTELEQVNPVSDHCRNQWVVALRGDEPRIRAAWQAVGGS
jgi:zinc protease